VPINPFAFEANGFEGSKIQDVKVGGEEKNLWMKNIHPAWMLRLAGWNVVVDRNVGQWSTGGPLYRVVRRFISHLIHKLIHLFVCF